MFRRLFCSRLWRVLDLFGPLCQMHGRSSLSVHVATPLGGAMSSAPWSYARVLRRGSMRTFGGRGGPIGASYMGRSLTSAIGVVPSSGRRSARSAIRGRHLRTSKTSSSMLAIAGMHSKRSRVAFSGRTIRSASFVRAMGDSGSRKARLSIRKMRAGRCSSITGRVPWSGTRTIAGISQAIMTIRSTAAS